MTQYQKDFVRMADSIRKTDKGTMSCDGLDCDDCPIHNVCASIRVGKRTLYVEDVIKAVSEWAKEHPVVTVKDKYKEVFGVEPVYTESEIKTYLCPKLAGLGVGIVCTVQTCEKCKQDFWGAEYKPPKADEEGV